VKRKRPGKVALALAGGGPFGAIYEIGALLALSDSIEGLDLNGLDSYVGVSAGGLLAAALANGIPIGRIHAQFIEDGGTADALAPGRFHAPRRFASTRAARGSCHRFFLRAAWRYATRGKAASGLESIAPLGRAIPTGLFDNEAIHRYLAGHFRRGGTHERFPQAEAAPLPCRRPDLDTGRERHLRASRA
jgi:predicted acylesterase/phospholipase RssA